MKIEKILVMLFCVGSLFLYSHTAKCARGGRNVLQVITGTGNDGSLPWAADFDSSNHMGNRVDLKYAVWPRKTITFSPFTSVVAAAVIGGAAVHYGLPSKALACAPKVVQEGISNMSERAKMLGIAALLAGLGACIYAPTYWGVLQGCFNKLCGRDWDSLSYRQY